MSGDLKWSPFDEFKAILYFEGSHFECKEGPYKGVMVRYNYISN